MYRERISQLTLNLKALEVSDLKQNVAQHLLDIAEIDTELRIARQTFAANQDLLELLAWQLSRGLNGQHN
jgi:hypothetical protein